MDRDAHWTLSKEVALIHSLYSTGRLRSHVCHHITSAFISCFAVSELVESLTLAGVVKSNFMERAGFRGVDGDKQRAQMQSMLESSPGGIVQSPAEVAEQVYMAAIRRKDEVFVGPAYNAINAMHRTFGVNPFSMARP